MRSSALADAIEAHRDEIVAAWLERATATVDPAGAMAIEVQDGLPGLLTEVVRLLRESNGAASTERATKLAAHHGMQRFHAGFNIGSVVREYGILRRCIRDFARAREIPVAPEDNEIVIDAIHAAIADAVEQFAVERDRRIREQSDAHFSFVAHELRNALAAATITAQGLERARKSPDPDAMPRLRRSLGRLRDLVDSSLAGARLRDVGRTGELRLEEVSLAELVAEAVEEVAGRADDQGNALVVTGAAPPARADRRLIQSAVSNLIRNAVKFTRPGGTITIRLGAGEGVVSLEVEDECGGLSPDEPGDLFLPFVQKGPDRSGFGLGLAITRQAVEAHHGHIQVSNLPGKGCVFMMTLPLGMA
jgi:hypothetical protein